MRLVPTPLPGVVVVEPQPAVDERGSFARAWDATTFANLGLGARLDQCNISRNLRAGTLRGLHWQVAPHEEAKLVRCTRGRVFDVAVDVQPGVNWLSWWGIELDSSMGLGLYVPQGFAHGFLTLEDDCDVEYLMTSNYSPEHARGLRYDDLAVGIEWPRAVEVVSARDQSFPPAGAEQE